MKKVTFSCLALAILLQLIPSNGNAANIQDQKKKTNRTAMKQDTIPANLSKEPANPSKKEAEEGERNVMLNASDANKPREIQIGLPSEDVNVYVATGAYKMEGVTGRAGRSLEEMKASAFRMPCAETNEVFVIVASRSHLSAETEEYIEEKRKIYPHVELVSVGSSIKICKVCEGLADEYPRFAPTMEWDTAAGHAIAKASGAEIYQAGKEEPLKYNKPDLLNPWFVVKRN